MAESRNHYIGLYATDQGFYVRMRVREDHLLNNDFGWASAQNWGGTPMGAKGFKPRRVYGKSPTTGRRSSVVCGTMGAPLYLGTVNQWTENTDANTTDTYVVTGYSGETQTIGQGLSF